MNLKKKLKAFKPVNAATKGSYSMAKAYSDIGNKCKSDAEFHKKMIKHHQKRMDASSSFIEDPETSKEDALGATSRLHDHSYLANSHVHLSNSHFFGGKKLKFFV